MTSFTTGRIAEAKAVTFLEKHGMQIVAKNFNSSYGEIDIICTRGLRIFFVEVKYRASLRFGYPEESISTNKVEKIAKTIEVWLTKHPDFENHEKRIIGLSIVRDAITVFDIV